ncbi:MAG TPA: cyclophilin-like fold protein [Bryobacteraceae bacterium]|nr:cyclophilin-like fold protein [Bryobacteraceae bacterium]
MSCTFSGPRRTSECIQCLHFRRRRTALILAAFGAVVVVSHASAQTPTPAARSKQIKLTIASKHFIATIEDNATASAFRALLPMTVNMSELNGNEKYFKLSDSLPVKAFNPRTIQSGDLMIYGDNTLVLFYKSFPTSYDYTRLGRIKDTTGLTKAIGSGSVKVTFEVE